LTINQLAMNYDDERVDMVFKLFTRFCKVVLIIGVATALIYVWTTLKK